MRLRSIALTWLTAVALAGCCGEGSEAGSTSLFGGLCQADATSEPAEGIWWSTRESGRGFALERQGRKLAVGTFVFDDGGRATWYTGLATQQSDGRYSGQLRRLRGGPTLTGAYRAPDAPTEVADIELEFSEETIGSMRVQLEGAVDRQVIALDKSGGGARSNASFANGSWWNENESGRGYTIEVEGDDVSLAAFAYDEAGEPVWYWGSGKLSDASSFSVTLSQMAQGQTLTGPFRQAVTLPGTVGTVSFEASGETTGTLMLPNGRTIPVKRLAF